MKTPFEIRLEKIDQDITALVKQHAKIFKYYEKTQTTEETLDAVSQFYEKIDFAEIDYHELRTIITEKINEAEYSLALTLIDKALIDLQKMRDLIYENGDPANYKEGLPKILKGIIATFGLFTKHSTGLLPTEAMTNIERKLLVVKDCLQELEKKLHPRFRSIVSNIFAIH